MGQIFNVAPRIVAQHLRGIRIDGALAASSNVEAFTQLNAAVAGYVVDYLNQPPSLRHNSDRVEAMGWPILQDRYMRLYIQKGCFIAQEYW